LLFFFILILGALVGFIGGSVGLVHVLTRGNGLRDARLWLWLTLILASGYVLVRCGASALYTVPLSSRPQTPRATEVPIYYDVNNPEVRPFIDAINAVDRTALGFTPIPPHTRISIGRTVGSQATYNVMINVFSTTARTIAFKQQGSKYIWIGEQETHTGPLIYDAGESGRLNEEIILNYETVPISGFPLNTLSIVYRGPDPRLAGKRTLTLEDVQPILQEWQREMPQVTPILP
jgi:hypothetical protein